MQYHINITEVDTGNILSLVSYSTFITVQFLHPYYTYASIVSAVTIDEGPYSEIFIITTPEDGKILLVIKLILSISIFLQYQVAIHRALWELRILLAP